MDSGLSVDQKTSVVAALAGFDCAVIYLFGSRAVGDHRAASDADIAFLPRHPTKPLDRFYLANRLSEQLGIEVDLIDLSDASTVLAKEVITKGLPLFIGNPYAHQTFEMHTLSDYARLNEQRKEILTR
jgi:uncharacterized protein